MQTKSLLLPALFVAISSVAAQAQLINVNVYDNSMVGTAHLGNGSGDLWNHVTFNNGTSNALVDSTGYSNPTNPITLTSGNWFIAADSSTAPQPFGDGPLDGYPNLFTTYALGYPNFNPTPADPSTLDFTGLADSKVYQLVIYSRNQPGGNGREFTITAPNGVGSVSETLVNAENTSFSSIYNSGDSTTYGDPTYVGNYIDLLVKTDTHGNLDLNFSAAGLYNEYDISGLQLEATPEPSTATLLLGGMGLLFCLLARNRRQGDPSSL